MLARARDGMGCGAARAGDAADLRVAGARRGRPHGRLASDARFGLAFIALNSLLLLDGPDAQRQAMRVLAEHLRPGGVAIVDVVLPDAADLAPMTDGCSSTGSRQDAETGDLVTKLSSARHDAATATVTMTTLFDTAPSAGRRAAANGRESTGCSSAVPPSWCGTRPTPASPSSSLAGDHQGTPFGPGAERIVLIAVSV